jgi:hypothetical protein
VNTEDLALTEDMLRRLQIKAIAAILLAPKLPDPPRDFERNSFPFDGPAAETRNHSSHSRRLEAYLEERQRAVTAALDAAMALDEAAQERITHEWAVRKDKTR